MLLEVKNKIDEFDRIAENVQSFCTEHKIPEERFQSISLILDEVVTNVMNYAYPDGKEHTFTIKLEKCDKNICICITDNGVAFDPLSLADPDTESSIDERQIGGLGIFLVKQLSENLEYTRVDDKNQLYIVVSVDNEEEK
ncbi:hypothetical protein FACS1894122_01160 [Alphaproteobacteria bacterium]|nr:hypothetical protein FACS1894122_01160 [Alphaproteobacteria bacterium]